MTAGRRTVFQRLRQAALAQEGGPTDGELMERFLARRDADALEALIRRHGPMVLAVCRRVLGNEPDAEDAFQAAFLVFVRKAASVRARQLVGPWLYGVAYRTALKARSSAARRRVQERRAATMIPTRTEPEEAWAELLPLLDRELNRLPDKYRIPVVLCELEGLSRKEAARRLGVPEGTLSSRLATAKRMLGRRLAPHCPAPFDGVLAAALARGPGVPPPLLASTTKAAALFAAGQAATAVVSARVAALVEGVLKTMLLTKWTVAVLAAVALIAAGSAAVACRNQAKTPAVPAAVAPAPAEDKSEVKKEKPEWGEAVDGVQARLRPTRTTWDAGETQEFILDMRNQGERAVGACRVPNFCEIEWDGQWHQFGGPGDLDCKEFFLNPGKQIDDWVKVPLDIPWIRKAAGDKEERLQVAAGKHTVRVAFLFDGGPRPVSQSVEIEVGKESAWGDAVGGVQARLRTPQAAWKAGEAPTFILDLRTVGKATADALRIKADLEIEVDGIWYWNPNDPDRRVRDILSSDRLDVVEKTTDWVSVAADKNWEIKTPGAAAGKPDRFPLPPGKHTIRVSYETSAGANTFRPISGPIEIEVGKESAWGDADGGVQARIRTPKIVWDAGEAPTFILDLRNQGKTTPNARRVPFDCQIEVDGTWYTFDLPSGPYPAVGDLLEPGKQIDGWATASPDKNWGSLNGKKDHFPLPAGKHTVRIAYSLQGVTPAVRPVSGPIEIEVGKESAWGDADGGVQARIRTAKAVWDAGEAPTFILDLRNQGKQTPHAFQTPFDCQIEVDGIWYSYAAPVSWLGPPDPTALEPGKQFNDWLTVTPDANWMNKAAQPAPGPKDRLPLAPGKHTIYVAFPFNDEKPAVRPVSGSLDIDIKEK